MARRRPIRRPRRNQRGFKLIEVLIAMSVLGVTAAGLFGLHVVTVRGISESGSMTAAMEVASQRVEMYALEGDDALRARLCPAASGCTRDPPNPDDALVANCSGQVGTANIDNLAGNSGGALVGSRYRYDTAVTILGGAQAGGLLTTVSVCWREANGLVRRVQSQRLIAPRSRS